jgi:hypothetical protein
MVGLLNAPPGTKLYHRMKQEGRLLRAATGDNTDFSMNFRPKMDSEALLDGYRSILQTIYSPKHYYARVMKFLKEFRPSDQRSVRLPPRYVLAGIRSAVRLGIVGRERFHYWRLFFWSLFKRPRLLPLAITLSIYGYHFRKVFLQHEKMLREG